MRKLLNRNFGQIWNLIHITDHNYGLFGNLLKTSNNTVSLKLFPSPVIYVFRTLIRLKNNMFNFGEPFFIACFVLLKEKFFRPP